MTSPSLARSPWIPPSAALLVLLPALLCLEGCANFRRLAADLDLLEQEYRIVGRIVNADDHDATVMAAVVEWDREGNRVYSGDRIALAPGGAFIFSVRSPTNQHVMAYADENGNGVHNAGEPVWIHTDSEGNPSPVVLGGEVREARVRGSLAPGEFPAGLRSALESHLAGRTVEEAITHQGVRLSLGEIVDLDDPRFAATRGSDGLWTPATMAITTGFGIYFLEPYDPARTPVLFIHGAAGSPQDWRFAMERLDRSRYQPWFHFYPSGGRLENTAAALHAGVELLRERYGFRRVHVVAHSMGGLVARRFVEKAVLEDGGDHIDTLITFSTPWAGHEAAGSGVRWAPSVVPSWRDVEVGSEFLEHLFDRSLRGRVDHHILYGHRSRRSLVLPRENDGTVSVASQLRAEAVADAVDVAGWDEDHVSILSARGPLIRARDILDEATSRPAR